MNIWVCLFVFVVSEHNSSMSSFQLLTHDALTFLYVNPFRIFFAMFCRNFQVPTSVSQLVCRIVC